MRYARECLMGFDCKLMTGKKFSECPNRFNGCKFFGQAINLPYNFELFEPVYDLYPEDTEPFPCLTVKTGKARSTSVYYEGDALFHLNSMTTELHQHGWRDAWDIPFYREVQEINYEKKPFTALVVELKNTYQNVEKYMSEGFCEAVPLPYVYSVEQGALVVLRHKMKDLGWMPAIKLEDKHYYL